MLTQLGRYRIEREIGRGATGVVYFGHDDQLNRRAAIKVLVVPDKLQGSDRREMVNRFRREARAAAAGHRSSDSGCLAGGVHVARAILGKPTDHRSDIFSMGILLHEILTGRRPFDGATITQITHASAYQEAKLLPTLKPELASVIQKALSKESVSRFQSAREMSLALHGKMPVQIPRPPSVAQVNPTIVGPASPAYPSPPPHYPSPPPCQPMPQVPYDPPGCVSAQVVKDYLVESILVTLFCCLPCGIVAIVYASQARSKRSMGDHLGAARAGNTARTWAIVSFALGLGWFLLLALLTIAGAGLS